MNRLNWDDRAEVHATDRSGTYPIERVLSGGSSLHAIETIELGDVSGKDIVHLQCHIGLDTISLRHLGARSVTGLDFSTRSIAYARDLAERSNTDVTFVAGSVYDAPKLIDRTFDLVYVTWGALNWLSDIKQWGRVVAALLRPGGRLYLLDTHPQLMQVEARDDGFALGLDWRTPSDVPLKFEVARTYTGDPRLLVNTQTCQWIHPLSAVINALISSGLVIDFLNEHEAISWKPFPSMIKDTDGQYVLARGNVRFPLSYSIGATRLQ